MRFAFLLLLSTLVVNCAHFPDVVPGVKGVNSVVTYEDEEGSVRRYALAQAKDFCNEDDKKPVVISEKITYKGTMSEEDYKKYKMAARAAGVLGGGALIAGGKNESKAGGAVAIGAGTGDAALGKPYQIEMSFECK